MNSEEIMEELKQLLIIRDFIDANSDCSSIDIETTLDTLLSDKITDFETILQNKL